MNASASAIINPSEMERVLMDFVETSTREQLLAELNREDRKVLLALEGCDFLINAEFSVPAYVSFYKGEFCNEAEQQDLGQLSESGLHLAANEELALAA